MKKVYETPMTEVIHQDLYDSVCDAGVISPAGPGEFDTNERNEEAPSEEIWDKEW